MTRSYLQAAMHTAGLHGGLQETALRDDRRGRHEMQHASRCFVDFEGALKGLWEKMCN